MMKQFFLDLLNSSSKVSSRRFIAILAFIVIIVIAFIDLFTSNTISEFIFDALMWIVLAGMGFATSDKFSTKGKKDETTDTN